MLFAIKSYSIAIYCLTTQIAIPITRICNPL